MNRTHRMLVALAATAAVAMPATAQEVLEEVVVTAQKREQSLQDVGISVSAFTGDQIEALGYTNAQEVTALAPGVSTIQPNGPSNYAIAIRGVAQNDFISNQESPVSIYIDDVYLSQMSSAGFMLFDMERVEILRGPQGTLYGRNATGGLAHYISRKPTEELDGYAQLTAGEHDQVKFQGAIGGALMSNVFGRVSVATHHNNGYVENRLLGKDINNANDYAGRAQLLVLPTENTEFLFNLRGALQQIRTGFFENVSARFDASGNGFNVPGALNFNGYRDTDGDVFAGDYDLFGHQDMETWGASGTFKWDIRDNIQLTSITDYQEVKRDYLEDSDASPVPDFNFYLVTDSEQFSQELRISGDTERSRWVAGFYYLDIEISDANGAEQAIRGVFNTSPALGLLGFGAPLNDSPTGALGTVFEGDGTVLGVDNPYTTETTSWSIFGQYEYDILPQWTGILGFRWIEEEKEHTYDTNLVDFQPGFKQRNGNPRIIAPLIPATYNSTWEDGMWSAKIELDWRPNDDWLVFASWNRGVKGGGFNAPLDVTDYFGVFGPVGAAIPLTDNNMQFGEEKLDAYEVGFKASLFGGLARLNASAFYYDYADYQAFQILGLTTFIVNSDAESHGFEVELQANPFQGLDVLLGVGYLDTQIQDLDLAGTGQGVDTQPVQSPKWNVNGLLRYTWPAFRGNMALQGDFHYRSRHYFSVTQAPASTQNGYGIANARMSYSTMDDKWEAAVFVNNLFDEEYLVQTFDLAFILGMTEQYYGLPRWVGGSVRYRF